jgi:hypothetical protein
MHIVVRQVHRSQPLGAKDLTKNPLPNAQAEGRSFGSTWEVIMASAMSVKTVRGKMHGACFLPGSGLQTPRLKLKVLL